MDISAHITIPSLLRQKINCESFTINESSEILHEKNNYFTALFDVNLVRPIYDPFTLIIIMSSQTSLTDCYTIGANL